MTWKWLENKCYPTHPKCGSAEEWVEWEKVEKSKPLCNFFVNELPMWVNTNINKRFEDFIYWFKYRFQKQHKYHLIDTGLEPDYHEIDTRMLHGMFNLLKDFCEDEMPHHDHMWSETSKEIDAEKDGKKYKREKFTRGCRAASQSFDWQKSLVYTEDDIHRDEDKHLIGKPTPQAETATELEVLYLWWVVERPEREDPYEKYDDPYFDKMIDEDGSAMRFLCERPPEEKEKQKEIYKLRDELEQKYKDEDDEMFIRLIKIRRSLWT